MKKLLISITLVFIFLIKINGQVPEKLAYQGLLRNTSGELVKNTSITVKISLLKGSTSGDIVYSESHTVSTNNYGQFSVQIGDGTVLTGTFNAVDWSQQMYQKTEVANPAGGSLVDMGTTQLISVPYSFYSGKAKVLDNNLLYFTDSDTLFAVKDREGNIVFAVFPDGAKIYTPIDSKGKVGGFAVSGRTATKLGEEVEYFKVTPDSTRIWVNDLIGTKGKVGGFAVSGRTATKGIVNDYLFVTPDSTRVYINDSSTTKGKVGGFAVSGRTSRKGEVKPFLDLTPENSFIGQGSGKNFVSGYYNSFMGYNSGFNMKYGISNVFIGYESGYSSDTTDQNVFIGDRSGRLNTKGRGNVFIGNYSGYNNTIGLWNNFFGNYSGYSNTEGISNTFYGAGSGSNNTIGNNNTFIGSSSGGGNITGSKSTCIGENSGTGIIDGEKNVVIGSESGYSIGSGSNNVLIGYRAGYYENGSNKLHISNTNTYTPLIYGEFDNQLLKINGTLDISYQPSKPAIFKQATEPDIPDNTQAFWVNTDDGNRYYLILDVDGVQKKTELL